MAYNYVSPSYCYGPCHQCNMSNSRCCYTPHCYHCSQSGFMYNPPATTYIESEELAKPPKKSTRVLRKNKLTKSHSACSIAFDSCGDIKENNTYQKNSHAYASNGRGGYDCKRNANNSSYSCSSSSRKAEDHGAEERGRREPQPGDLAAPGCDINRLMAMVSQPFRVHYCNLSYNPSAQYASERPGSARTPPHHFYQIAEGDDDDDNLYDSPQPSVDTMKSLRAPLKHARPLPAPTSPPGAASRDTQTYDSSHPIETDFSLDCSELDDSPPGAVCDACSYNHHQFWHAAAPNHATLMEAAPRAPVMSAPEPSRAPMSPHMHSMPFYGNMSSSMGTCMKFMPPASCFMLVKSSELQQAAAPKVDRQVQCCFDISSDFCTCSRSVCEFCAKKIICTCNRIRCCMCCKLKSTADRTVHHLSVCRCPKSFRSCEVGASYLRFNSSPALNKDYSCHDCDSSDVAGSPITY